jgi:hypothetical protein
VSAVFIETTSGIPALCLVGPCRRTTQIVEKQLLPF